MAGYLPASGNSLSMSQINSVFDSRGNNLNAYRGTTWYTAAGGSGTFSSGTISFNDFYLKGPSPAFTVSLADMTGLTFTGSPLYENEGYAITVTFNTNGTWDFNAYAGSSNNGNWGTPTTTNIGSNYWVKWTRTFYGGGSGNSASATSGWQQISSARVITVVTAGVTGADADYTVQISSDSSGTTILATAYITMSAPIVPN
jgi:hypothetical protein